MIQHNIMLQLIYKAPKECMVMRNDLKSLLCQASKSLYVRHRSSGTFIFVFRVGIFWLQRVKILVTFGHSASFYGVNINSYEKNQLLSIFDFRDKLQAP